MPGRHDHGPLDDAPWRCERDGVDVGIDFEGTHLRKPDHPMLDLDRDTDCGSDGTRYIAGDKKKNFEHSTNERPEALK
jgi:hypothetical protein